MTMGHPLSMAIFSWENDPKKNWGFFSLQKSCEDSQRRTSCASSSIFRASKVSFGSGNLAEIDSEL